jgi:integrase
MAKAAGQPRTQGSIRRRGSGYQVRVYAGVDPLTARAIYLTETTHDEKQAQRVLRRLLTKVDERHHARTKATLGLAVDSWLQVHQVEANTLRGYEANARRYIKPALGNVAVGKVTAQMLEEFYAQLRQCRVRCNGRAEIEHRADGPHECRTVEHRRPPGRRPAAGYPPHDCEAVGCRIVECRPHACRPLSPAMVRQIHITISAALSAAVRWEWIKTNPADVARTPKLPAPQPDPPTPEQAAQITAAAWEQDDNWGTFVWLTMVTGMRRAELLGLRWYHVDLIRGVLEIHRMRRIALDPDTVELLAAHRQRYEDVVRSVGAAPTHDAFVFSHQVAHDRPYSPEWVTHRYAKMCAKLGIDSHLHALRHYSATELLTAGVDLRTVAGRLGHAGGGATTLRVYAAWVDASDRRAAEILGGRVQRPDRRLS